MHKFKYLISTAALATIFMTSTSGWTITSQTVEAQRRAEHQQVANQALQPLNTLVQAITTQVQAIRTAVNHAHPGGVVVPALAADHSNLIAVLQAIEREIPLLAVGAPIPGRGLAPGEEPILTADLTHIYDELHAMQEHHLAPVAAAVAKDGVHLKAYFDLVKAKIGVIHANFYGGANGLSDAQNGHSLSQVAEHLKVALHAVYAAAGRAPLADAGAVKVAADGVAGGPILP